MTLKPNRPVVANATTFTKVGDLNPEDVLISKMAPPVDWFEKAKPTVRPDSGSER